MISFLLQVWLLLQLSSLVLYLLWLMMMQLTAAAEDEAFLWRSVSSIYKDGYSGLVVSMKARLSVARGRMWWSKKALDRRLMTWPLPAVYGYLEAWWIFCLWTSVPVFHNDFAIDVAYMRRGSILLCSVWETYWKWEPAKCTFIPPFPSVSHSFFDIVFFQNLLW